MLLLRLDVEKTGKDRSLAARGRLRTVATLSPVGTLAIFVVQIGRASAPCIVVRPIGPHTLLINSRFLCTEASSRVWASSIAELRRATLITVATPLVDPERPLLAHKWKLVGYRISGFYSCKTRRFNRGTVKAGRYFYANIRHKKAKHVYRTHFLP